MADSCSWPTMRGTIWKAPIPSPGLFRVFFYDDWTRPLPPEGFAARVIIKDSDR